LRVARRLLMLRAIMMTNSMTWMAALALIAPACKKQEGSGAAAKATEGGALPDELAKWMPAQANQLLQGVWETHISFYQAKTLDVATALEITGDKARASDGQTDHTLALTIKSPCAFELAEEIGGGGTASYEKFFLVQGGKLAAIGDGAGGYRKGKEAIACTIGQHGLYTSDASGACKTWRRDFMDKSKWTSEPAPCAWTTKDGKEALQLGKPDDPWAHVLFADGDLLWSEQLRDEAKAERFMKHAADFAAAKAWAESERKAHDPVEQAKAAGGKVGDTSTVAGLQATWGTDKSLKGKQIELNAVYENSNSMTSNGVTSYNIVLVDGKDSMKMTLMCSTKTEVKGLVQWDKVKVKGTVGDFGQEADLEDCTVTKVP